jgi:uncharacterized protein YnzC (UPF0291/DUF896 family)
MMDAKNFNKVTDDLDATINMVDDFMERAHEEGISTFEAVAMQNHIRREFSPKQRANFRNQVNSLYRQGKIDIDQKQRMDQLLDKASKVADQHFTRLARIVPEGQELHGFRGAPDILNQHYGDSRAKKVLRFLGLKAT